MWVDELLINYWDLRSCALAGIVIVGDDTVGHFDLGIFVASIVPNGPADKDGRIRPGTEWDEYPSFQFLDLFLLHSKGLLNDLFTFAALLQNMDL